MPDYAKITSQSYADHIIILHYAILGTFKSHEILMFVFQKGAKQCSGIAMVAQCVK